MNLSLIEDVLLRALRARVSGDVQWLLGPAYAGPGTGLQAQVFVHAAGFADGGGMTPEGARVARSPVVLPGGASGFSEQRPGHIDIHLHCRCARHAQAQVLAGLVLPAALEALETLAPPLLSDPADASRRVRFADHRAVLHAQTSQRLVHDCVAVAEVLLHLRLEGFLHVLLARPGGLVKHSAYGAPLRLQIQADPTGTDLQREHVMLFNDGADSVDLGGWTLHDAARRPHVYTFASTRRLAGHGSLKLWTGRGVDDADNVYWGRRQAVWNNTGDVALLRDPDGEERARADWLPPLTEPAPAAPKARRPRRQTR